MCVGDVYLGVSTIHGEEVTIRHESVTARLQYKCKVYKTFVGDVGVLFIRCFGSKRDYSAMILRVDLFGPSLQSLSTSTTEHSSSRWFCSWLTNSSVLIFFTTPRALSQF
jgi:hypothetical protein